ncbi:MAG: LysR family transcriptional regulator, partial [Pseudomonadota bacterium]
MDWDDLRFFLAVAHKGSIRAAAAALGVNHSTVSRRIDGFERKLGVRLFERLPTGYLVTPAGEDMMQSARRMEEEAAAIDRRVAGRDHRLSGPLRVTMPDSLAQKLLMPDIVAFSDRHPEIELELVISYVFADLNKREADVAIRMANDPPGHLVGRRVVRQAKAVYASRDYLARHDPAGD